MVNFTLDLKNAAGGWHITSSYVYSYEVKIEFTYPSRMTGEQIIESIISTIKTHEDCKWLSIEDVRMTLDCSGLRKWLLKSHDANFLNPLRWLPEGLLSQDLYFSCNAPIDLSLTSASVTFSKSRLPKPIGTEQISMPKTLVENQESLKKFKADHPDEKKVAFIQETEYQVVLLIHGIRTRLSSLCSFRTLYFTPESGPATEGFSCRGAVMNDEGNAARKIRKLRASRDLWKQRSAEKQQEIRQLRVTVRDLSSSRENWKTRVKELEQQLQAAHEAHAAVGPGSWIFFGGLMDNQAMPRTRRTPITLSSD